MQQVAFTFGAVKKSTMNFPADLKYTKDHEWMRIEGDVATIGITDFAQGELGDIVFVEIETNGQSFAAHEVFGTVEAVKTVSDLYMPVTGTIIEVNVSELGLVTPGGKVVWGKYAQVTNSPENDGCINAVLLV